MAGPNLFALVGAGIWRSADGGATWHRMDIKVLEQDFLGLPTGQSVLALDGYLLVGTAQGIFHSADSGTTWRRVDPYRDSTRAIPSWASGSPNRVHISMPARPSASWPPRRTASTAA